jgi:hypothetical protein
MLNEGKRRVSWRKLWIIFHNVKKKWKAGTSSGVKERSFQFYPKRPVKVVLEIDHDHDNDNDRKIFLDQWCEIR